MITTGHEPMDSHPAPAEGRFEVRSTSDSHFSWLRTRLSIERTLMSWIRTSVAMIGFGFTIFQFFQRFHDMHGVAPANRPDAPWYLGLALIAAGIAALAVSGWQYRWMLAYLWSEPFRALRGIESAPIQTPLLALLVVVMLIGVFAFCAVLLRAV
jgi:putative membrane protein